MNEQDRQFIRGILQHLQGGCSPKDLPKFIGIKELLNLLGIIDELDKQLAAIVDAGEPFRKACEQIGANYPDFYGITVAHPEKITDLRVGHFRRLAKAMKEVKRG